MPDPLLLLRVGWMESYSGPDRISGGGAHVAENGEGGEMWNFAPDGGRCYGYAMSRNFAGLDLAKLASPPEGEWHEGDELRGIDIGFFARRPDGRQVIVGCYLGATAFHKQYRIRPDPGDDPSRLHYCCEVVAADAILLLDADRRKEIPYAPVHGGGLPGRSNVWYGQRESAAGRTLTDDARAYMRSLRRVDTRAAVSRSLFPDQATVLAIESASMVAVRAHFEREGFRVSDVHLEGCGHDLTAVRRREKLRLEVKGHLGDVVRFELTPNEYAAMCLAPGDYRVCLVRRALQSSVVEVLQPVRTDAGEWELRCGQTRIALHERTGARASQTA